MNVVFGNETFALRLSMDEAAHRSLLIFNIHVILPPPLGRFDINKIRGQTDDLESNLALILIK